MKSLVIYVWGRLGREESGTQIFWLPEEWPPSAKEEEGRQKRGPRACAPTPQPLPSHIAPRSHGGGCTRPLTQAARLQVLMGTAA